MAVVPPTVSLQAGGVQDFTATVTNDPGTRGVTWAITGCTGGAAACGTLTSVTSSTVTYTAPTPVPSDAHLGITATSVADNTRAASATVAIAAIAVSVSPASASVAVNAPRLFTATVANDPTKSGVTWSLTGCSGGAAVCGTLDNVTSTTATYTAPTTEPPGTLRVTATSVTDNTKAFTATVAVIALGSGRISFVSSRDGNEEIYVMNADGSGLQNLTNSTGSSDNRPVWSPDGSKIAFTSNRDAHWEIYVMNADGSGVVRLTTGGGIATGGASDPAWSPDGSQIAFVSTRDGGNWEIYVMNADGSGLRNLTNNPAADGVWGIAWSPDGTRIAFDSDRDGNHEIFVMNADGSALQDLTNNPGSSDTRPAWSPDGTRIAFLRRNLPGNYVGIYLMNADGSGVTQLVAPRAHFDFDTPVWSPDGSKIAYELDAIASCGRQSCIANANVYVMNADGSGLQNLTLYLGINRGPAWSLDGTRIAFSNYGNGSHNDEIYVMNADGSGLQNLTNNPGDDYGQVWRPR